MADQTTVPSLALSAGFVMFDSLYAFYYIEDITRWCEDMKLFYFRVAKKILYERAQRVSKILFLPQENKNHIFKLPCNVLFII